MTGWMRILGAALLVLLAGYATAESLCGRQAEAQRHADDTAAGLFATGGRAMDDRDHEQTRTASQIVSDISRQDPAGSQDVTFR